MICYMEVKTPIKFDAVHCGRHQYICLCLLQFINLPTPALTPRQLDKNRYTTFLFFSLSILRNGTWNGVKAPSAINVAVILIR